MKTLLMTIDFRDPTDKFWWDSSVKNQSVDFDPEKETVHQVVKRVCEDEGMELSYNGKPQSNIYRDMKNGNTIPIGYLYRGKGEVQDRDMPKAKMVFWDVWVTLSEVTRFPIENIDKI